ncbi:MAG: glycosyltransferase family 4 protein [Nitrospiraceae bacterium]|nr:glycosyltransferase family 4 protein [Nitrospiraceae bacterium]
MRILILNRRDIRNPSAGGAEVYTHEIARGLTAKYGCEVSVYASEFPDGSQEETLDGVRYLRRGGEATVHLRGFCYALRNKAHFDCIVDEFNGIGFFTFFFRNSVLLIHQLYREFWFRELGVAGAFPYVIEPMFLKRYRKKRTITVSNSTKHDLERLGFHDVRVVMNALRNSPFPVTVGKEDRLTMVFLGRLRSTKRPEEAIRIFKRVKEKVPSVQLWMIGKGPAEEELRAMAKDEDGVVFKGWVSEGEKMNLLKRAHVLLVPSVREGFGINVIESAAVGTPAIGYDVPGLRDSIRQGETGYLVHSAGEAARAVEALLADPARYDEIAERCICYAREFDWGSRVDEFWAAICGPPA